MPVESACPAWNMKSPPVWVDSEIRVRIVQPSSGSALRLPGNPSDGAFTNVTHITIVRNLRAIRQREFPTALDNATG